MKTRFLRLLPILWLLGCAAPGGHKPASIGKVSGPGARPFSGHPYEKHYEWKDWRVYVREVAGDGSPLTWFSVEVSRRKAGVDEPRYKSTFDSDGRIQRTWFTDLHGNGWPDLVVFTTTGEKAAVGSIKIFECQEKGFHRAKVPKATAALLVGYRGGDDWRWEEGSLVRRFPVYAQGDDAEGPTGGVREIRFKWEKSFWRERYRTLRDLNVFTRTPTSTGTATSTRTLKPTKSRTSTRTPRPTRTLSSTPTPRLTATPTFSFTRTRTPKFTGTWTATQSWTSTRTPRPTNTLSSTPTRRLTATPTFSFSRTLTSKFTRTETVTPTWTPTDTRTPRPTQTRTYSRTPRLTATETSSCTFTATSISTRTRTPMPAPTDTPSSTPDSRTTSLSTPTRVPERPTLPILPIGGLPGLSVPP